jgi:hypothetical protein
MRSKGNKSNTLFNMRGGGWIGCFYWFLVCSVVAAVSFGAAVEARKQFKDKIDLLQEENTADNWISIIDTPPKDYMDKESTDEFYNEDLRTSATYNFAGKIVGIVFSAILVISIIVVIKYDICS